MSSNAGNNSTNPLLLHLRALLLALQFLTVLPIPLRSTISNEEYGRAVRYFPLAGLLVGLIEACAVLVLQPWLPAGILAAIVLLIGAMLTGGLHLDGLADTCDGLFVFRTTERRLEIMRDSRVGSYGVAGLICVLLVQYASLNALLTAHTSAIAILLLAGLLSRWAMTYALVRYPYARGSGAASGFKQFAGRRDLVVATLLAAVVALLIAGIWGVGAFFLVWIVMLGLVRWMLSMLPGLTGDTYGAICELSIMVLLIVATIQLPA